MTHHENYENDLILPYDKMRAHEEQKHAEPPKKKKRRGWRVLLIILLILLAMLAAVVIAWYTIPRAVIDANIQSVSEFDESEVAVTPDLPPARNVLNIALFGIDQASGTVGRSDAIIIVSIDKDHNKIKMTSLARDSLVPIDGHGEEKLTHAWAYGHAKLALKTLNQNYGMNITEYAYINFTDFKQVIDYIGGVYVDLSVAERDYLNELSYLGTKWPKIEDTGRVLLTGAQALQYSRDREDGGTNRTARQREVLVGLYSQMRTRPLTQLTGMVPRILQLCHTTLSGSEVVNLMTWALATSPSVETLSLPNSQTPTWTGVLDKSRGWVQVYDMEAASQVLHNFIYETDVPVTDVTVTIPSTTESEDAITVTDPVQP